jgi:5-methylthioadenosine/S-adenosylhomocysteine deaminase
MSMRRVAVAVCLAGTVILTSGTAGTPRAAAAGAPPPILLEGTVVTMNEDRDVIHNGRVLVRDGRIAAVWQGGNAPADVDMEGVVRVPLGRDAYIYPGLINLHDHPFYDVLPLWQPPASHRQPSVGRPAGTEPYANRYQWNTGPEPALERARLITNPSTILTEPTALGRLGDVITFAKARMILGGTTTTQGGGSSPAAYDALLARNVESAHFGRQRIRSRVPAIGLLTADDATALSDAMSAGLIDAWLVHLAEGVRDADRRPGDPTSSRAEFATLKARQLLNDATVVVHGVGLEPEDFSEMASAPSARADGTGDGRGAKLVWSPLSNLLLYGKTAAVYDALAAGVLVSLGTDWTPSGSPNLLTELKVADRALRDASLLGDRRHIVPALTTGHSNQGQGAAERALDRLLVEMVTINPARSVRWDDQVGSIERGKVADLLVIQAPAVHGHAGIPASPYRPLIDATEQDVELVLVGGSAQAGDLAVMSALKPGDFEVIASGTACFEKAIDVIASSSPQGSDSLVQVSGRVSDGLRALGGDHPLAGGGPSSPFANTWSYLKARIPGYSAFPDLIFNFGLVSLFGTPDGQVNLEAIVPPPLFTADDHWWFATLEAARNPATGLTADSAPPYGPYAANANHVTTSGSPFAAPLFRERWYGSACAKR